MANKKNTQQDPENMSASKKASKEPQAGALNWRGWVIRGVALSVLIFVFVAWRLQPIIGNTAYLWAGGLALAILGWLAFSYYLLNR